MYQSADTIAFLCVFIELILAEMIAAVCVSYTAGLTLACRITVIMIETWQLFSVITVEVLREQGTAVESKVCAAVDNKI